jgi:hypothetical protein
VSSGEAALSTAVGTALIVLALLDVFATLFSRGGSRSLSHALIRATWVTFRTLSPRRRLLSLAGPASFLVIVGTWAAMLGAGFALIYWPQMPEAFIHAQELSVRDQASFLDSMYVSLVTLATLGYGDISPAEGWLRMVAPLESLLGLGLFTASVSWLLSIYPVLSRRRALAYEICLLEETRRDPGIGGPPSPLPAAVYAALTSRLVGVERDLVSFPVTYYFHEDDSRFALPAAMGHLLELAEEAEGPDMTADRRLYAGTLRRAVDDFATSIAGQFHRRAGGSTRQVLEAYARDHAVESHRV